MAALLSCFSSLCSSQSRAPPPNGRVNARGGFTVEPYYMSEATNAKAADTTRGGSRVAGNECWAAF